MELRPAGEDDATTLFGWRNDAAVRSNFLQPHEVTWHEHLSWLRGVLADPKRLLLIAEEAGVPVGTIRFDIDGGRAEVSVTVAPIHQGRGLGAAIIEAGTTRCQVPVDAYVRVGNGRSIAAFRAAGYRDRGHTEVDGMPVIHLSTD